MRNLDLRDIRCPLALVLLKQQLIALNGSRQIKVLFTHPTAMKDICLYLEKKNYCYSRQQNTLLIEINE